MTDTADQTLEGVEFVLLLYDGCYNMLCIETKNGVSRKVGVAQFVYSEVTWKHMRDLGVMMAWKRVHLH